MHRLNKASESWARKYRSIYYLHNPEAQLQKRTRSDFYKQLEETFTVLEGKVAAGKFAATEPRRGMAIVKLQRRATCCFLVI